MKITVSGPDLGPALRAYGPDPGAEKRSEVYFWERPPGGRAGGPLLDAGLILRRQVRSGTPDHTAAILRPCRMSRLSPRWLLMRTSGAHRFTVEGDWSGERRVVAAALTRRVSRGQAGGRPWSDLQRAFVAECADVAVDIDTLVRLGPVPVRRWHITVDGLAVDVQRWTVSNADLLELSTRVDPGDADLVAPALEALVRRQGVDTGAFAGTTTELVLRLLAARERA